MTDPSPRPDPNALSKISARLNLRWREAKARVAARLVSPGKARITRLTATLPDHLSRTSRWLSRHYIHLVFASVGLVIVWALCIGLWRVPLLTRELLDDLSTASGDRDQTRTIITALAAVLASIAIFGTIIVQSIGVWTRERQTRTIEQGHVTDRLTKAIEQLGAEKTVKRIETDADGNEIRDSDGRRFVVETTTPNLEVRLGAIYALERIARDSERDHVTIMEILCAYIRENAKIEDQLDHGSSGLAERPDPAYGLAQSSAGAARNQALLGWLALLRPPRIDLQAVLTVLGRRSLALRQTENTPLDLSQSNLRCADLRGAHLERAIFRNAEMQKADFFEAKLAQANFQEAQLGMSILIKARMEGANLSMASLERAWLTETWLEGANLHKAWLTGAILIAARLDGADLSAARMDGAVLGKAQLNNSNLRDAQLARANLTGARLEGTKLRGARLVGATLLEASIEKADLREADFRVAHWEDASVRASLAHSTDFRGGQGLTQNLLNNMIGDEFTILPEGEAPDTGQPWFIWNCWDVPPTDFDQIIAMVAGPLADDAQRATLRASFLCGPDNPRVKTGTPLHLDAPYPAGHPLANRD